MQVAGSGTWVHIGMPFCCFWSRLFFFIANPEGCDPEDKTHMSCCPTTKNRWSILKCLNKVPWNAGYLTKACISCRQVLAFHGYGDIRYLVLVTMAHHFHYEVIVCQSTTAEILTFTQLIVKNKWWNQDLLSCSTVKLLSCSSPYLVHLRWISSFICPLKWPIWRMLQPPAHCATIGPWTTMMPCAGVEVLLPVVGSKLMAKIDPISKKYPLVN